jgi:hypothetical protein
VCNNRGAATKGPATTPVFSQLDEVSRPPGAGPSGQLPNAPGAVASMVLGIVGVVMGALGIVLGIVALVLGNKARDEIRAHPGVYGGEGYATAGRILGIVGIAVGALSAVLVVAMFGLVSQLAQHAEADVSFDADSTQHTLTVTAAESGLDWEDFSVSGSAGCALPIGTVDEGDVVQCAQAGDVRITYDPLDDEVFDGQV